MPEPNPDFYDMFDKDDAQRIHDENVARRLSKVQRERLHRNPSRPGRSGPETDRSLQHRLGGPLPAKPV